MIPSLCTFPGCYRIAHADQTPHRDGEGAMLDDEAVNLGTAIERGAAWLPGFVQALLAQEPRP